MGSCGFLLRLRSVPRPGPPFPCSRYWVSAGDRLAGPIAGQPNEIGQQGMCVLNRVGPAPTRNHAVARGMPKFQPRLPDRVHTYSRPQRRWPAGALGMVQGHVAPSVAQHGSARTDRQLRVPEMAGVLTAVPARDLKKDLPALIDKVRSAGYPSGYLPSIWDRRGNPGIDRAGPCRARSLPRGGVHWRVGVTPRDRHALRPQAA
jgi:hypothetical protein